MERSQHRARPGRREEGLALFVTVLMLVFMGALAMAALDTVTTDRRVAGLQNRSRNAFYAAEAATAEARSIVAKVTSRDTIPGFHSEGSPKLLGDTSLYDREARQPRFYGDPDYANPIRYVEEGAAGQTEGFNLSVKGQRLSNTVWLINVVGESADGSTQKIEVAEVKVMSAGY